MRGYGIMDHRSQYHMYEYLEMYREYQLRSSYSAREGAHDSERKYLERQMLMMMDDDSSSETSDCKYTLIFTQFYFLASENIYYLLAHF